MASFQAKIGWKMPRKREYKKYRSVSFLLDAKQKIPKKFKNLKNAIMASFQAKIGLIKRRKGENKYHRSVPFLPNAQLKIPKQKQKNSKNENIPLWLHFKPKQVGKCREREKIKIIGPFRSYTTRNRKFQKNSKKIQKTKKIPFWLHFKQKQVGKG